jgi:DNA-directed RNA polymerase subunit RPC12/RpoP
MRPTGDTARLNDCRRSWQALILRNDQYCTVIWRSDGHDALIAVSRPLQFDGAGRLRQRLDFEGAMPGYQSTPSQRLLNALERPHCPYCKSRMMLVGVDDASKEYFECPKCDHANRMTSPNDRFGSSAQASIGGKSKSPE